MTIRAVLFDAVGTLIYPQPSAVDVYFEFGKAFGSQVTRDNVARRLRIALQSPQRSGRPGALSTSSRVEPYRTDELRERLRWRRIVASVFDDLRNAAGELFESLWDHFAASESWRVFGDVVPAWQQLDRLGHLLGIASNFDERLFRISQAFEPLKSCEHFFCSSRIGYAKPSRRFFRTVEQILDLPSESILLVGDDWQCDVVAAAAAGWQSVHLDRSLAESGVHSICTLRDLVDCLA